MCMRGGEGTLAVRAFNFSPFSTAMVKLDLLVAKFDYYVVSTHQPGVWPVNFSINREGVFLYLKPVQFALLWPWVKL